MIRLFVFNYFVHKLMVKLVLKKGFIHLSPDIKFIEIHEYFVELKKRRAMPQGLLKSINRITCLVSIFVYSMETPNNHFWSLDESIKTK